MRLRMIRTAPPSNANGTAADPGSISGAGAIAARATPVRSSPTTANFKTFNFIKTSVQQLDPARLPPGPGIHPTSGLETVLFFRIWVLLASNPAANNHHRAAEQRKWDRRRPRIDFGGRDYAPSQSGPSQQQPQPYHLHHVYFHF